MQNIVFLVLLATPLLSAWTVDELSPLVNIKAEFERFKTEFGRNYSSVEEEHHRLQIFSTNLATAMNLNSAEGEDGAVFGVTKFMDLTPAEFKKHFTGFVPASERLAPTLQTLSAPAVASPCTATSCDWRKAGAVSPVKDQGGCGSCWAFSAVEGLESAWFLAGNTLPVLSPQQLVSCDKGDGGCAGGDLPTAYKYIESAGGVESNQQYPYTSGGSGSNGACKFNSQYIVSSMKGWTYSIPPCFDACKNQNENNFMKAVAATGPSSICVNADPWQFYTKGVFKGSCPGDYRALNHCVQLVGYQVSGSSSYWIIRNSWNTNWGEQGYMYIQVGKNLCGLADEATFVQAN